VARQEEYLSLNVVTEIPEDYDSDDEQDAHMRMFLG
jgi:hypothetical protein